MTRSETDKQENAEVARRNRVAAIGLADEIGFAAFRRAGFKDVTLVLRWREIAGPEVARLSVPVKLSESAAGGVLTLKADSAAATFLQHESRRLCERINSFLGQPTVARLRFVPGAVAVPPTGRRFAPPPPPPQADPARAFAGPERLKDALLRLASARRLAPCD